MKNKILELLEGGDLSANALKSALKCRHEAIYMALVQMEAEGTVTVWAKTPGTTVWCKAEVLA